MTWNDATHFPRHLDQAISIDMSDYDAEDGVCIITDNVSRQSGSFPMSAMETLLKNGRNLLDNYLKAKAEYQKDYHHPQKFGEFEPCFLNYSDPLFLRDSTFISKDANSQDELTPVLYWACGLDDNRQQEVKPGMWKLVLVGEPEIVLQESRWDDEEGIKRLVTLAQTKNMTMSIFALAEPEKAKRLTLRMRAVELYKSYQIPLSDYGSFNREFIAAKLGKVDNETGWLMANVQGVDIPLGRVIKHQAQRYMNYQQGIATEVAKAEKNDWMVRFYTFMMNQKVWRTVSAQDLPDLGKTLGSRWEIDRPIIVTHLPEEIWEELKPLAQEAYELLLKSLR